MPDASQAFRFDPNPDFDVISLYDEQRNAEELGLGRGIAIYEIPDWIGGGIQTNLDLSRQEIKPEILLGLERNAGWISPLVSIIILGVLLFREMRK